MFGSDPQTASRNRLLPRWIFLRALAAIYISAFYSLLFQIKGLIGPNGVLPAGQYLTAVDRSFHATRFWFAPSLLWFTSTDRALMALCWIGMLAALAAFANLWPRLSFSVAWICFLSFVAAAGDFSGYQSDGMLLEAGFLALFFAPSGFRPELGAATPPSRASLFLLQWEWFRIYFESGMVKLLSGDQQWRHLTAMNEYYQNGPLPTWIGWYVQHLPEWFHKASAAATLGMELLIVLLLFFPRRLRLICFLIVTPWEIGVILTANYTFLNYLVLMLGFLLLDDGYLGRLLPARFRIAPIAPVHEEHDAPRLSPLASLKLAATAVMLTWIAYATTAELIRMPLPQLRLPDGPVRALEPFRIANRYGLFAVMTNGRYEIEFQGSNDGKTWTAYPFRYKPQALDGRPGIYAPYQPRFDWNLWFASLGDWRQNNIVPLTEERLLDSSPQVLSLFAGNPFAGARPRYVRAVLWQYWFTSMQEKRTTGNWWRRNYLGIYAPVLTRRPDGQPAVVQWPDELPEHD
ncbi:lipase maturation factor family protein [Silvibacterium acidisoli]|uniref:lipase maturation factor family protein n=1 Tax=Acidobacteriaceae bacterium ZG23-2 TaxID=2883246 RepID=UPI00406C210D